MGWLLNTAEKVLIDAFNLFIEEIVKRNTARTIYIWGASVRGTLLGILLEQNGYLDFLYVDNDERKWGTNINGHLIISADKVKEVKGNGYIVVPVEHYAEIRLQLLSWNMVEGTDFYILKSDIYHDFCEEFFRQYNGKYLVFGESFLTCVLLDEEPKRSMTEDLYMAFGRENMKVLSIGCMGMEESYYYLQKQIALDMRPEKVWLFVNFETLSENHYRLPRVQHPNLAEMIQATSDGVEPDLSEYIELGRQRAQNYKLELQYSPRRTYVNEPDEVEVQEEYTRQQLLNIISLEYEECLYLCKILAICNENVIDVSMIIVPVNYQRATELLGKDFEEVYKRNIDTLSYLGLEYNSKFWDMSELLEKQFFESRVTLQDGIKRGGRKKIIECLKKYEGR